MPPERNVIPAGEPWFPIRLGLPDNPKVMEIAAWCGVSLPHALGAVVMVWRWGNLRADEKGLITPARLSALDVVGRTPELGKAFESVGWAEQDGESVRLPYWWEFNGAAARRRMADTIRKQKAREASRDGAKGGRGTAATRARDARGTPGGRAAPLWDGGNGAAREAAGIEGDGARDARARGGDPPNGVAESVRTARGQRADGEADTVRTSCGPGEVRAQRENTVLGGIGTEGASARARERLHDALARWAAPERVDERVLAACVLGFIQELLKDPLPLPPPSPLAAEVVAMAVEEALAAKKPMQGVNGAKAWIGSVINRCRRERRLPGDWGGQRLTLAGSQ